MSTQSETKITNSEVIIGSVLVQAYCQRIADWVYSHWHESGLEHLLVVPVLEGALPLFGRVQWALRNLQFDYQTAWVDAYDAGTNKQHEAGKLLKAPVLQTDPKLTMVVVLDDIFDTGATFDLIYDSLLVDSGVPARNVRFACLIRNLGASVSSLPVVEWLKPGLKGLERNSFFSLGGAMSYSPCGLTKPGWLYGFGMDNQGRGRGLREIRVLKD